MFVFLNILTVSSVSTQSPELDSQEQLKKDKARVVAELPQPSLPSNQANLSLSPTPNPAEKNPQTVTANASSKEVNPTAVATNSSPVATKASITPAQPQSLSSQGPVILIRLRSTENGTSLIERLAALEPVRAGRFQPVEYIAGKNKDGVREQILAVIRLSDKTGFSTSGLEYTELDAEADTARYYSVNLPQEPAPEGENWLDEKWQQLDQVGNRVIFKATLPFYVGFGIHARLQIEKLPPQIYVPGLMAACPCPALAGATFSTPPLPTGTNPKDIKSQLEKISEENLRQITNQIVQNEVRGKGALNTRYTGSAGSIYMAERLYTYFFALGLKVEYDSFVEKALGTLTTNVIAEQSGEKEGEAARPLLLIAHYDSLGERNLKGISNPQIPAYGANDNGVGLAGLMEVARLLSSYRFKQPVRYIAFGAEEQGMLGSQHYASNHLKATSLTAVINIDSFGYNPGADDWVVLTYDHNSGAIKDALVAYEKKYNLGLRLEVRQGEAFFRSDDYYFSELGYNSVALTDSFALQSPNNHTQNDTLQNVNFKTARKVVQLALAALAEQADRT